MQCVVLLVCSIISVRLQALKRALFGALQNGRHSIGDLYIRQKYGSTCSAFRTCLEGSVFTVIFIHLTTCNILQMDKRQAHTFLLNTNFRSRIPHLPAITMCYRRGRKACVYYSNPFLLSRITANRQALERTTGMMVSLLLC